jgi:Protein of unknown function (DUF3040)
VTSVGRTGRPSSRSARSAWSARRAGRARAAGTAETAGGEAARARAEREALADIRDALGRDDPGLTRSFGVLAGPRPGWCLAGMAACAVLAGAAFALLGVRGIGVVTLVLVLGGPVVVCLALPTGPDPAAGPPGGEPPRA